MTISRYSRYRSSKEMREYWEDRRQAREDREIVYESCREELGKTMSNSDIRILLGLVKRIEIPEECWCKRK